MNQMAPDCQALCPHCNVWMSVFETHAEGNHIEVKSWHCWACKAFVDNHQNGYVTTVEPRYTKE